MTFSGIFISIIVFLENDNPAKTMAWLLILVLFPFMGFLLYFFFGHKFKKIRKFKKKKRLSLVNFKNFLDKKSFKSQEIYNYIEENIPDKKKIISLIYNMEDSLLSCNNKTKIFTTGAETFANFFEAIDNAQDHIHMEFYIFRDDSIGKKIQDKLIKKAREGISIKIIYDGMGNFGVSKKFIQKFEDNSIEIVCFSPVIFPLINNRINYRNHRKIMVVDGKIGFIGGFNIGDEYLGNSSEFHIWRDTHLKIEGSATRFLQKTFLEDWLFLTGTSINKKNYFPAIEEDSQGSSMIQIVKSGPDSTWEPIMQTYFSMITNANKNIYLTTPYFIPTESILMALKNAALAGVDVQLLLPGKSDYHFLKWASFSYLKELLESGVKVHLYNDQSFIHSKTIVIDGSVSSIGTANIDVRSFNMNFEINAFVYNKNVAKKLEQDFFNDVSNSHEISLESFNNRPIRYLFLEAFAKLFSPLL